MGAVWIRFQEFRKWSACGFSGLLLIALMGYQGSSHGQDGKAGVREPVLLSQAATGSQQQVTAQRQLEALISAAKNEGEIVFYSSQVDHVLRRVTDAFSTKYSVRAQYVRLGSAAVFQRFANEASAGSISADMITATAAAEFAADALKRGWIEPVSAAGIPVLTGGEFPSNLNTGLTAIIQVAPWGISYNSDKVKGADIPKDWTDLLNPKWKGQLLLPDPRASASYYDVLVVILDKYGESFFAGIRAQNPRVFAAGVPAIQALGAGEGAVLFPTIGAQEKGMIEKGAPLVVVTPGSTTGNEHQILLSARAKAKHPNAARLFANFLMSREGNAIYNLGQASVYEPSALPKDYRNPTPRAAAKAALFSKLLGLQ